MSASISLICLNVERSLHLDKSLPFLRSRFPEVLVLQEVFEKDLVAFANALGGAEYVFAPMSRHIRENPPAIMGTAVFSRLPVRSRKISWYSGNPDSIPDLDQQDPNTWNNKNFSVPFFDVEKDDKIFRAATTHLTWTADGMPTDLQRLHMRQLLKTLIDLKEFVLAGDFNTPRGGEMFAELSKSYKDNIPEHYTSSLDSILHRAGHLQRMVDGLFTTSAYIASEVELVEGVSDHKAIVATISKAAD